MAAGRYWLALAAALAFSPHDGGPFSEQAQLMCLVEGEGWEWVGSGVVVVRGGGVCGGDVSL